KVYFSLRVSSTCCTFAMARFGEDKLKAVRAQKPDDVIRACITCSVRAFIFLPVFLLCLSANAPAQWKVREITIEGNQAVKDKEILDRMGLKESKPYSVWKMDEDRVMILALYRSRGFLQAEVEEFRRKTDIENQRVDIFIEIKEGLQTILKKIELTGNTVFTTRELLDMKGINTEGPLDARKFNLLKRQILNRYYDNGYLYADVKDRYYYPAGDLNAEVYFDIDEGVQVKVGRIEIKGNKKIKTYIIRRGLEIREGEVYTEAGMRESKRNLYRTGIIRDIRHELLGLEEKKEMVDVVIHLTEGDFRTIGLGAGIGDIDGLRGNVEWGHYNLLGRALSLMQFTRLTYQPFEKDPAYKYSLSSSITLRQPYFLHSRIEVSTTGMFGKVSYSHHEEEKTGVFVLFRNMFTERKELGLLVELNNRRIFDVDTAAADQSIIDNMGSKITNLVSPIYMSDRRDDRFNPERGYMYVAKATMAGGPLLAGSINFYLFSIEGTYIRPLWRFNNESPLIIAGRVKLGVVREFGGTPSVPPTEAFNIGGAQTLRGYKELSIGPINDRNAPGNCLVQANLELRYPIRGNLGGVLFLDAANVFRNVHFDERFHLLTTAGLGLRYRTPVGPLRIDAALKLNNISGRRTAADTGSLEKERSSRGRIHFGIGHAF
ncbi:MAG: BamA/TamA family outer membrane protein, partial [Gemmatimonadota bacterium]|nr:BamA/TamA family outer membrane protein [Gemmatimonadota bacterium]